MKLKLFVATFIAIAPLAALAAPAKALTFYSDRATWLEDASNNPNDIITEDFSDREPNDDTIQFGGPSGDFITSTGTGGRNLNSIKEGQFRATAANSKDLLTPFKSIIWTFSQPVIGFFATWDGGLNRFDGVDPGLTLTVDYDDPSLTDAVVDLYTEIGNNGVGDWGFLTSSGSGKLQKFSSVTFTYTGADPNVTRFAIDDLAVAIPTPALLPGLVGMGAAALRKRKQQAAVAQEV